MSPASYRAAPPRVGESTVTRGRPPEQIEEPGPGRRRGSPVSRTRSCSLRRATGRSGWPGRGPGPFGRWSPARRSPSSPGATSPGPTAAWCCAVTASAIACFSCSAAAPSTGGRRSRRLGAGRSRRWWRPRRRRRAGPGPVAGWAGTRSCVPKATRTRFRTGYVVWYRAACRACIRARRTAGRRRPAASAGCPRWCSGRSARSRRRCGTMSWTCEGPGTVVPGGSSRTLILP